MKKTTIDNITPIEGYLICTQVWIDEKESALYLPEKVKKEREQPALKIRRLGENSKCKVGQVFLIGSSLNGTFIKINNMDYVIIPEFEIRAWVNDG